MTAEHFSSDLPNSQYAKQMALAQRLRQGRGSVQIPRRLPDQELVLSIAQERLWFLSQLEPDSPAYNRPLALRIRGEIDLDRLKFALQRIVQKHEVLRSSYLIQDDQPRVVIAPRIEVSLAVMDYPGGEPAENWVQRTLTHLNQQPVDLMTAPLFRLAFLRLGSQESVLLIIFHHIIFDGWSEQVFLQELGAFYDAPDRQLDASQLEPELQFFDFAAWKRTRLQGQVFQQQLDFWKETLKNAPEGLNLPLDFPRPARVSASGAVVRANLGSEIATGISQFSRSMNTTPFTVLLAAFQTLLFRYTGQGDVVVGTPVAGRSQVETERLIGFFVNTLVMRAHLDGDMTFAQLLEQVKTSSLQAFTHQDIPFERLVQELHPERDLSRSPLFQVLFQLRNIPRKIIQLGNAQVELIHIESGQAKYDLVMELEETPGGLSLSIEYRTDLFKSETIQRMTAHFETLLGGILARPNETLATLPLLTENEKAQLDAWNATAFDFPQDALLHSAFEAQAEKTPHAFAVVFEGQTLTYRQLNQRANQLAHWLRLHKIGVNSRIGVCLERSFDLITALLAILKAGGCFVPLDTHYPQDRLDYMVQCSEIEWVLTNHASRDIVPASVKWVTCLDDANLEREINWLPVEDPESTNSPQDLAYIIFTSGSTGKPKGVMITHQGVCSRIYFYQSWQPLGESDGYLQKAPLGFDPSIREIFWPLSFGGRVILAKPGGHLDNAYLVDLISRQHVTHMNFVPSLLNLFLDEPDLEKCGCLQHVLSSGERLTPELRDHFFRKIRASLHNFYGPTETSMTATIWTCQQEHPEPLIPVGRPVGNTQIIILDENQQIVPQGVPGEICLAGVGLSPGYINQPELTGERFIRYPGVSGERIYRTGDLGRYLADGALDYLGRMDHQVKLFGVRVELGEIESVIQDFSPVKQACVLLREITPGNPSLVAYLTTINHQPVNQEGLIQYLKVKLPASMVPSAFVVLEAFPTSPNGKIARDALPDPVEKAGILEEEPQDGLERDLARLWARVLKLQKVARNVSFFDLGGHSMLAVRLFSEIKKSFGCNLPLGTIFIAPTVKALAEVIRLKGWESPWKALVPIQPKGELPPLFCVHGAGGEVFGYQSLIPYLNSDQPILGLQEPKVGEISGPLPTIEAIARVYLDEVIRYQPEGSYHLAGYSFGGLVAYEMACQLEEQGKAVASVILFDTHTPQFNQQRRAVSLNKRATFHWKRLNALNLRGKLAYFATSAGTLWGRLVVRLKLKRLGSEIQPIARPSAVNDLLYLYRKVGETFQPKKFSGRIFIIRAVDDLEGMAMDPSLGWGNLIGERLTLLDVPGNHLNILKGGNIASSAAALNQILSFNSN